MKKLTLILTGLIISVVAISSAFAELEVYRSDQDSVRMHIRSRQTAAGQTDTGIDFDNSLAGRTRLAGIFNQDGITKFEAQAYEFLTGVPFTTRLVILQDGKVGIGITDPKHKLHIAGNIGLSGNSYINFGDTTGTSGYGLRDNGGGLQYKNSSSGWKNFNDGRLSGGTNNYAAYWTGPDTLGAEQYLLLSRGGTGSGTGSIAGTEALTFAAGGTNQNITLLPSGTGYTILNGNVGIGTTSPSQALSLGAGKFLDFEGTTDDAYETLLQVTNPTADRTVILPDAGGEVSLLGQSIESVEITDGTIATVDLANDAVTEPKLAISNGPSANQLLSWNGSALTWANPPSGTVNPGNQNYLTYYPATGTTVDDLPGMYTDDTKTLYVQTDSGSLRIGPQNTGFSHLITDRSRFYFNTDIVSDGSFSSFSNDNLNLQTGGETRVTVLGNNDTNPGNVGIGTIAPGTRKLKVQGDAEVTGWLYSGYTIRPGTGSINCLAGEHVIGGGCSASGSYQIKQSYPSSSTAWTCSATGGTVTAYAICARVN